MHVHLAQLDTVWEDRPANLLAAERAIADVAPGDLVLLPEMFDTGFSFNIERTADTRSETGAFLSALAARLGATVLGGTTALGHDGRGRNRALVFGPSGEELARYDKVHPFSFGRESERFTGGDRVVVFDWGGVRVCPVVCYDLRFPELFRAGLDLGAEMFCVIANWPSARVHHWRSLLVARAIENQAYVAGVNRAGSDPHLEYPGASTLIDPRGDVVVEGGGEARVVRASIELERIRAWRAAFPAIRDRRQGLQPSLEGDGVICL